MKPSGFGFQSNQKLTKKNNNNNNKKQQQPAPQKRLRNRSGSPWHAFYSAKEFCLYAMPGFQQLFVIICVDTIIVETLYLTISLAKAMLGFCEFINGLRKPTQKAVVFLFDHLDVHAVNVKC